MTVDTMDAAKEILAGCLFLPKEKIADDAMIAELKEMDSLIFETIVVEIENWAGREADPMRLLSLNSVRDLADLLAEMR